MKIFSHQHVYIRQSVQAAHNISDLRLGVDTALITGRKVFWGSHALVFETHRSTCPHHSVSAHQQSERRTYEWITQRAEKHQVLQCVRLCASKFLSRTNSEARASNACSIPPQWHSLNYFMLLLGVTCGYNQIKRIFKWRLPTGDTRPTFFWTPAQLGGELQEWRL